MSSDKLGVVEMEILTVISEDYEQWQRSHPYMDLEQYGGLPIDEMITKLPWWVKVMICVNGFFRIKNLQGEK